MVGTGGFPDFLPDPKATEGSVVCDAKCGSEESNNDKYSTSRNSDKSKLRMLPFFNILCWRSRVIGLFSFFNLLHDFIYWI